MSTASDNRILIDYFANRSSEFLEGFEVGKIFTVLKDRKFIDEMRVVKSNEDAIKTLLTHFGYIYKLEFNRGDIGTLTAYPPNTYVNSN